MVEKPIFFNVKSIRIPLLCIFSAIFLSTWIGFAEDPEFSETHTLLKKAPSLKFNYYSPTGESDKTLESLSPELQQEELAWQDIWTIEGPRAKLGYPALILTFMLMAIGGYLLMKRLIKR